jgi:hypothetical protein
MTIKILFYVQGIAVFAFAASSVLQFMVGNKQLGLVNACFFFANYLIFFWK